MCGILIADNLSQPFTHRTLDSLRKRGPDQLGFWCRRATQIGHTRLAIIGLDERGCQPIENDTHVIAYNGEIYNFEVLRERLIAQGVCPRTGTDTEVLLEAWSRYGSDILRDLEGFWAFAILDKQANVVTLVRDQLGIKPLYYYSADGVFIAATLLKTIADVLPAKPTLDYEALSEYVRYQLTFGEHTFFQGVKRVLPGQLVQVDLESHAVTTRIYEDILKAPAEAVSPLAGEWIADTRRLLADCVRESTISDTSFTTFCSGGLDSSLITRIAKPEVAYHCNFSDPECNETFFAQQVVYGTSTRLLVINAQEEFDLVQRLRDIIADFDEPTVGSVILPLDDLLRQVKRRYKVILTGTGGDELFGGYVRYQLALGDCYQDSYRALMARMSSLRCVSDRFELAHLKGDVAMYRFYQPVAERAFKDAFAACRGGVDGDVGAMLRFDRRHFLPALLNIDDKMCGRHSLESRPSLLHQRLVRHVVRADGSGLVGRELKQVLRDMAEPFLPKAVIARTDKMGFTTPIGIFVNNASHRIREQLEESRFRHLYDLKGVSLNAQNKFARETFGLLMLDLWLNHYA